METPTPDGPMSMLMRFWTSRRMVIIARVALTGIALHLVLGYGVHNEAPSNQAVDTEGSRKLNLLPSFFLLPQAQSAHGTPIRSSRHRPRRH